MLTRRNTQIHSHEFITDDVHFKLLSTQIIPVYSQLNVFEKVLTLGHLLPDTFFKQSYNTKFLVPVYELILYTYTAREM